MGMCCCFRLCNTVRKCLCGGEDVKSTSQHALLLGMMIYLGSCFLYNAVTLCGSSIRSSRHGQIHSSPCCIACKGGKEGWDWLIILPQAIACTVHCIPRAGNIGCSFVMAACLRLVGLSNV